MEIQAFQAVLKRKEGVRDTKALASRHNVVFAETA